MDEYGSTTPTTVDSMSGVALHALKLIEHATAPGNDGGYHENAYSIAHRALSDLKWGTVNGANPSASETADERDARRYRWLRECSIVRFDRTMYVIRSRYKGGMFIDTEYPTREELDAVIDAAILGAAAPRVAP